MDRAPRRMPDEERKGRRGQAEGNAYKGKRGFMEAKESEFQEMRRQ